MTQNSAAIAERMQEVKGELAERCAQDSDFRTALLGDPNGTIETEYGLEAGSMSEINLTIVVEEAGSLVVPIPPDMSEMELTDDQLDQVSGGAAFIAAVATTGAILGGAAAAGAGAQRTVGRRW